ncbi:MAG: lipase family protein [Bacteroidota bacterium]
MQHSIITQNGQILTQPGLNPATTLACLEGVLAAYALYNKGTFQVPTGYKPIAKFTGWDRFFFFFGEEESFGIIFQSLSDPQTLLVAVRGTQSKLDIYEDLWANKVNFQPFHSSQNFPKDVGVASGFNSIYTETGNNMTASMQQQIMEKISSMKGIKKVIVTGHSLGGALCSLLALDLAVSLPTLEVVNYTFASPRVGGSVWKSTYETQYKLEPKTYRIANYKDFVPSLPPKILGYQHVGMTFLVNFFVKNHYIPHPFCRHSLSNYQTVLQKAVDANPQHWYGEFHDRSTPDSTLTMMSTAIPSVEVPEWATEHRTFEENLMKGMK